MKAILTSFIVLASIYCFGQTPEKQGLQDYKIPYNKDTIHFYIYNPKNTKKENFPVAARHSIIFPGSL